MSISTEFYLSQDSKPGKTKILYLSLQPMVHVPSHFRFQIQKILYVRDLTRKFEIKQEKPSSFNKCIGLSQVRHPKYHTFILNEVSRTKLPSRLLLPVMAVCLRETVFSVMINEGSSWGNRAKFGFISNTKKRLAFYDIQQLF